MPEQLRTECKKLGLAADGGREASLQLLASHSGEGERGDGASSSSAAATMPSNLHSMSVPALRSMCAAHGVNARAGCSKDELIELLEAKNGTLPALEYAAADAGDKKLLERAATATTATATTMTTPMATPIMSTPTMVTVTRRRVTRRRMTWRRW